MTTLIVRHKGTGEELEVLAFAKNDEVFVAPPGHPEEGRIVFEDDLDPNPWTLVIRHGFTQWTNRLGRAEA